MLRIYKLPPDLTFDHCINILEHTFEEAGCVTPVIQELLGPDVNHKCR
jgi:hypothetical protein